MDTQIENPNLVLPVVDNSPLKRMIINYIGNKLEVMDGNITVEMAVDVFAAEFPEFLMAVAEENFLRGYEQAFADIEATPNSTVNDSTEPTNTN